MHLTYFAMHLSFKTVPVPFSGIHLEQNSLFLSTWQNEQDFKKEKW